MECSQRMHGHGTRAFSWHPVSRPFPDDQKSGSTIPRAAHLEEGSFSITWVVNSALHLRLQLLRAWDIKSNSGPTYSGCNRSIRCDVIPIVCSTCQLHFHRTCSSLNQSQKGFQGFFRLFCSWGAAALPSTVTVSSTNILPCRYHHCHTNI